jgi:hypothetical protein
MDNFFTALIPMTLFVSIAYAIKAVADARTRAKLAAANTSQDLVSTILRADEENRRLGALRWGIVLTFLAGGLGLIEWIGWDRPTAGVFAILIGSTGLGQLVFFAVAQFLRERTRLDDHSPV